MDDFKQAIEAAVHQAIFEDEDEPGLVLSWHVVAAYRLDGDGDRKVTRYWQSCPDGTPSYVSVGLMTQALASVKCCGNGEG